MTLRKQVKYNAKRCLCNSWGKAVAISLMGVAIYLLFAIIEMTANPASSDFLPDSRNLRLLASLFRNQRGNGNRFLSAAGSIKSGHHLMVLFPF
mgnify:CR=1 FL=1